MDVSAVWCNQRSPEIAGWPVELARIVMLSIPTQIATEYSCLAALADSVNTGFSVTCGQNCRVHDMHKTINNKFFGSYEYPCFEIVGVWVQVKPITKTSTTSVPRDGNSTLPIDCNFNSYFVRRTFAWLLSCLSGNWEPTSTNSFCRNGFQSYLQGTLPFWRNAFSYRPCAQPPASPWAPYQDAQLVVAPAQQRLDGRIVQHIQGLLFRSLSVTAAEIQSVVHKMVHHGGEWDVNEDAKLHRLVAVNGA